VVACILLTAAFAASNLSGGAAPAGLRVEADRFVCVEADQSLADGAAGCADVEGEVATRLRQEWECLPQRHTRDGWSRIAWRCSLGPAPDAWSAL
jgi:hypothetical protein